MTRHDASSPSSHTSFSCAPPSGHTYLAIGQDLFSIDDYLRAQYNDSLHEDAFTTDASDNNNGFPVAFMFYTDIQTLRGLDIPVDYGSGVEYADGLSSLTLRYAQYKTKHPPPTSTVALQVGLWLNGTQGCRDILQGKLDSNMHRLFDYLLHSHPHRHVFLRVGYEFDNPSFGYSDDPQSFQQAFAKMVVYCQETFGNTCREHISFVWHSWAAASTVPLLDFYPGDVVVDWVGLSVFSQLYAPNSQFVNEQHNNNDNNNNTTTSTMTYTSINSNVRAVLEFAQQHDKPIMIAESTPFGGIPSLLNPWEAWFEPVLNLIEDYDISMFSYIDCDWDAQPMWNHVGFGDTRLTSNRTVFTMWQQHVIENPRFVSRVSCNYYEDGAETKPQQQNYKMVGLKETAATTNQEWTISSALMMNDNHLVSLVAAMTLLLVLMIVSRNKLQRLYETAVTRSAAASNGDSEEDERLVERFKMVYGTATVEAAR